MAHITLYRKFRPSTWDMVIGQDHIVKTLINQIKNDTVGHAYLFTGTRGTGKTSSAKIFAKAVNCLSPVNGSPCGKCAVCEALQNPSNMDIIEMDAASNNGVDNIRELIENVQLTPSIGRYKVYIIDEVHMLSTSAFNALLKTLEEPPAHVIFILATTDVQKLPQTILSRCIRFDFRLVSQEELTNLLKIIFDKENYKYDERALKLIALHGEGSVRDTLSLAEMCMSYAPDELSYEQAVEVLGASEFTALSDIAKAILDGDLSSLLASTNLLYEKGKNISNISKELSAFFRDLIAIKNINGYKASFTNEEYSEALAIAERHDNIRIGRAMDILATTENLVRYSTQPKVIFDASLVKCAELYTDPSIESLIARIRHLEQQFTDIAKGGVIAVSKLGSIAPTQDVKKVDLAKKLEEAVVEEEAPVFDVAEETPHETTEGERIWGLLLIRVRECQNTYLYNALSGITKPQISYNEGVYSLTINDTASLGYLSLQSSIDTLSGILTDIVGTPTQFAVSSSKTGVVAEKNDKATLVSLFGKQLQETK